MNYCFLCGQKLEIHSKDGYCQKCINSHYEMITTAEQLKEIANDKDFIIDSKMPDGTWLLTMPEKQRHNLVIYLSSPSGNLFFEEITSKNIIHRARKRVSLSFN